MENNKRIGELNEGIKVILLSNDNSTEKAIRWAILVKERSELISLIKNSLNNL